MLSYETYALVSDMVAREPVEPISMKGISREVVPYVVERALASMRAALPGDQRERMKACR